MESIDVTPTWGEVGNLFFRLVRAGKGDALEEIMPEVAKAFAIAEAFRAILDSLNGAQALRARDVMLREMEKQGF